MHTSTRRISSLEAHRIKIIQKLLEEKGIKLNQIQLGELISEYIMKYYNEFSEQLIEKFNDQQLKENDPLHRLLYKPSSRGKESNSVEEHDVII